MQLAKNQVVRFSDGHTEGCLEARWSERAQAWVSYGDDGQKQYSTVIEEQPRRASRKFVPSAKTCTVLITPCGETDKAYQVYDGSNGLVGRGQRNYYRYVAKSICYTDADGHVYAPAWA